MDQMPKISAKGRKIIAACDRALTEAGYYAPRPASVTQEDAA